MLLILKKTVLHLLVILMLAGIVATAQETKNEANSPNSGVQFRAVAETGFLAVLAHHVQFGQDGTFFNYVDNGGQDVLFPTVRLSLELDISSRNTFVLLYQPLRLESQAFLKNDLVANGITFPARTGVNFLYNFPFYRVSYLRELAPESENFSLAVGGSIQIRNATISFESTDGALFTTNRDVGIVPAFKVRSRLDLNDWIYSELEADGIYAPVSYLNGSDNDVVGAILDASLRLGGQVNARSDLFVNLRYLGGGAQGQSTGDTWPGDGYTRNWLHFMNVTAGFVLHI